MKRILTTAMLLAGCVDTAIQPMGPDTYIAASGQLPGAVENAAQFCAHRGMQSLVLNTDQRFEGASVVFRCLVRGDPELRRPTYENPPAAIIQDRRSTAPAPSNDQLVERAHPGWRDLVRSAQFKAWYARQPDAVRALGASPEPTDAIAVLNLYKRDPNK
jgi:hypothetical protein